jgi:hypothetical protein
MPPRFKDLEHRALVIYMNKYQFSRNFQLSELGIPLKAFSWLIYVYPNVTIWIEVQRTDMLIYIILNILYACLKSHSAVVLK